MQVSGREGIRLAVWLLTAPSQMENLYPAFVWLAGYSLVGKTTSHEHHLLLR